LLGAATSAASGGIRVCRSATVGGRTVYVYGRLACDADLPRREVGVIFRAGDFVEAFRHPGREGPSGGSARCPLS
jgi:hypothetical protein